MSNFYAEFAKPFDERRLPMRYRPHPAAVALVPQPVDGGAVGLSRALAGRPSFASICVCMQIVVQAGCQGAAQSDGTTVDRRRLPMRYRPHPDAVDVYRLWNERNGGRRRSTVVPSD
ncbi:hypothetical protein MAHJHV28_46570 [Mycobacterium avium subsp. hominissuis]